MFYKAETEKSEFVWFINPNINTHAIVHYHYNSKSLYTSVANAELSQA